MDKNLKALRKEGFAFGANFKENTLMVLPKENIEPKTQLLYWSTSQGCGATFRLESGEICVVSFAQIGAIVKSANGMFARFRAMTRFAATLYDEKVIHKISRRSLSLDHEFPVYRLPVEIGHPVLRSFANAIWHCQSATEVTALLNKDDVF